MSVADSNSVNNHFPPNGRKRQLNTHSTSPANDRTQTKLRFPPEKRTRLSLEDSDTAHPSSSSSSAEDMAHTAGHTETNNKLSFSNSFAAHSKAGMNNHTRKPGQGKKLVIKNRKIKPDLPENYEVQTWEKLRVAIRAVHTQQPISYSLEELYQAVENMCSHRMAAKLYDNLRVECERHVQSLAPGFRQPDVDDARFLLVVNRQWTAHCSQMIMIRSIFLYLDRTYAVPSTSLLSIWDLGLDLFGSLIVSQGRVRNRVVKGILALIHRERCGESVDRSLLKNLLRMLVDLQMYQEVFEIEFLRETETVYRSEALRMLRDPEFTLPDYLAHVDRRLSQESDRLLHYLNKSTRKPLVLCVEKQLIGEHQQELLDKGFESLLESTRYHDLTLLYKLLLRFKNGLALLSKAFSEYIKKSGAAIVSDCERDKTMVQELLELKTKVDGVICQAFQGNERFHDVVRDSFESVINRRQNKPAELIAKYVDIQLRSGNKEWSDEELDKLLDRVMVLFRYIHGKDVFEAFYKKDLAKRLLLGKSASFDAEKSMLLKLKTGESTICLWP